MSRWFGFGRPSEAVNNGPQTDRALPAVWYRSEGMYQLERRSIFSKRWILVSHQLRFVEPGDYVQITEAGFTFFLIKDRQGQIRGHHNVCRHRAYPLVEKDCGSLNVLACKYHGELIGSDFHSALANCFAGWSYGFDGKLAKAPKYQEIPSFDKTINGLYKVHVHVDRLGFVWVNLDSNENPSVPWESGFAAVDEQPRLQKFDMSQYHFDHQWEMMGDYNWKTLADNYNEVSSFDPVSFIVTWQ